MDKYTHIFHEAGNGFPNIGDEVICDENVLEVTHISYINTTQWGANYVYVRCEPTNYDIWDKDEHYYHNSYFVEEIEV